MIPTKLIERGQYWTDSLTLVSGCNPVSEGCEHCWSAGMASRFPWGEGFAKNGKWTGKVEPNYKALEKLEKRAASTRKLKPRVFQIWNDLFHKNISDIFLDDVFRAVWHCQNRHGDIFLILTKRPEGIIKPGWFSFDRAAQTDHIYIGVSVENNDHRYRIDQLIQNWPGKKFVSIEPCLSPLSHYLDVDCPVCNKKNSYCLTCVNLVLPQPPLLDQVIIGCESGSHRRKPPDKDDLYDMIFHCRRADTPVFLKQWEIDGKLEKMPLVFDRHWDQLAWNEKGGTG